MNNAKITTYDLNCEVPKMTDENKATCKQDNKTVRSSTLHVQ